MDLHVPSTLSSASSRSSSFSSPYSLSSIPPYGRPVEPIDELERAGCQLWERPLQYMDSHSDAAEWPSITQSVESTRPPTPIPVRLTPPSPTSCVVQPLASTGSMKKRKQPLFVFPTYRRSESAPGCLEPDDTKRTGLTPTIVAHARTHRIGIAVAAPPILSDRGKSASSAAATCFAGSKDDVRQVGRDHENNYKAGKGEQHNYSK
jgi:hypothetical protein